MVGILSSGLRKVAGNLFGAVASGLGGTSSNISFGSSNLLSSGRNKTKNLAYPLNVESDVGQGHYIIFEIMEQDKAKLKARKAATDAAKAAIAAATQTGTKSEDATGHPSEKPGRKASANAANKGNKQSGPNNLQVAQEATTAMPTCIALYMPPSVQVSYGANYGETEIGIMAETVNAGIKAFMNTGGTMNAIKAVGGTAFEGLKAGGAALAKAAAPQGAAAIFAINTGSIITPRMELMFEGIQRRTFSFNFTFLPKSEQEAEIVEQIVFQFKYHMASNYGGLGMGGVDGVREMEIPDFFNIRYMFEGKGGKPGAAGAASKKGGENMHLNLIKQCVLTSAGVEYGADQYKSYAGGRPQTTKLNLSFQELEIITKDYIKQGY